MAQNQHFIMALDKLESKKNYVDIVVAAVQQVYAEANGDAKLKEAKAQLVDLFNKNGIKFTEGELDLLIESAVKGMNDGVNQGAAE